ncbi:flagellar export chaperone FliS [Acetobacterium sp.]|uniref:flagellar export chaperone FliS n=1 Tax=Acetobacterium sp. TaxID=1872094 RepID=UPI002F42AB89
MQYANAYQTSKRQALETLTKGEVVVRLFEEASKQVKMGIFLTEKEDSFKAYNCIAKAQNIIASLNQSLDMQYPISIELNEMYGFIFESLGQASAKQDVKLMKELWQIINDLKDSFKEVDKLTSPSRLKGL